MLAEMLTEMEDYYWRMVARERFLQLEDFGHLTYFLMDSWYDEPRFYDRRCWTVPWDSPHGTIVYIDKMVTKFFNRKLFRDIEHVITDRHPQWRWAVWYRPGQQQDRRYTYCRRD